MLPILVRDLFLMGRAYGTSKILIAMTVVFPMPLLPLVVFERVTRLLSLTH